MTRRQVRADNAAIERLSRREATWDDRQDEALAGLLALARSADQAAPPALRPVPPRRRRAAPALAGLATTAVAAGAFAFAGLTGGLSAHPTATPTVSTQAAAVSRLLDTVRNDLDQASTAPTTLRTALLARAGRTLAVAESRTREVPSPTERTDLTTSSVQLQGELSHRMHQPGQAASHPASRTGSHPARPVSTTTAAPSTSPAIPAMSAPDKHHSGHGHHGGDQQQKSDAATPLPSRAPQR